MKVYIRNGIRTEVIATPENRPATFTRGSPNFLFTASIRVMLAGRTVFVLNTKLYGSTVSDVENRAEPLVTQALLLANIQSNPVKIEPGSPRDVAVRLFEGKVIGILCDVVPISSQFTCISEDGSRFRLHVSLVTESKPVNLDCEEVRRLALACQQHGIVPLFSTSTFTGTLDIVNRLNGNSHIKEAAVC